jgi:ubiquinol-cytochrome c reductase cytochrome c subunit
MSYRHALAAAVAAAAVCFASAGPSLAQAPARPSPERGYRLYMEKMCYTCHGTVGQGGERGTGPQIAPSEWPFEAFAQLVRHPRQDMPRYPARYTTDDDLRDIQAYLAGIKPSRPSKDIDLLK